MLFFSELLIKNFFSVGSVQGATGVWSDVRFVVVRSAGRLWQRKKFGTFHSQFCARLFLFLQVLETIFFFSFFLCWFFVNDELF